MQVQISISEALETIRGNYSSDKKEYAARSILSKDWASSYQKRKARKYLNERL